MKLATAIQLTPASDQHFLQLPFGLIGLPKLTSFSISPIENSWPFMSMNWLGDERMDFVVIDPSGLIPDYEIEVSDEDADALQLHSAFDALVLNIVTVHSSRPQFVTVNLVGPVVVNRHTGIGKQIIVLNWNRYSSQHPLIDQRAPRVHAA
jgi:flagellar assembly factor FliW